MGELHSISSNNLQHSSSSLGWDFHNSLGVFNADMSLFMDNTTPPFLYPNYHDYDHYSSSGYLQDALFEFNDRAKRRRLLYDHPFSTSSNFIHQDQGCWDMNQLAENYFQENFSYLSQMTDSNEVLEGKTRGGEEEEMSGSGVFDYSSSPKGSCDTITNFIPNKDSEEDRDEEREEKKPTTKIIYPFAVIKPGGIEGDLTLNDINRRILMPPTRPVKHPVGDYACRPVVVSPHGPGLSGKSVVALTRLHTLGRRGTITIIRTRN